MHGCGVYIRRVPKLTQPAEEHHAHPVRDEAHDGEVMAYEKIGQRAFLLKLFKKIQYLVLHGDVQRGHRLITYDKLRPEGDGARDAYALALSAGKLVRVSVKKLARNADGIQKLQHELRGLLLAAADAVCFQRLCHDIAHGHARIQRGVWILKNKLHPPPVPAKILFAQPAYFIAVEVHIAGCRLYKLYERPAKRRFAAAGFADERKRLALVYIQRNIRDGVHALFIFQREVLCNMLGFQKNIAHSCPSIVRTQRTRCPGAISTSSGMAALHSALQRVHRGEKLHPSGR